jgi:hypothetical protein
MGSANLFSVVSYGITVAQRKCAKLGRIRKQAGEVLGRSLDDLPPQTRCLRLVIDDHVASVCDRDKMERTSHRLSDLDAWVITVRNGH